MTRAERPRDELAVKLALAVTVTGVDVAAIVQAQRKHALAALQDYTRVKGRLDPGELAASLVLESMIFQCEAEIRWLDHVEARVLRHAARARPAPPGESKTRPVVKPRHRPLPPQGGEQMSGTADPRAPQGHPHPRQGRCRGPRPARRRPDRPLRGAGGRHGPVGLGQVNAAVAGRRPGLATGGEVVIEDTPLASQSKRQLAAIRRRRSATCSRTTTSSRPSPPPRT